MKKQPLPVKTKTKRFVLRVEVEPITPKTRSEVITIVRCGVDESNKFLTVKVK